MLPYKTHTLSSYRIRNKDAERVEQIALYRCLFCDVVIEFCFVTLSAYLSWFWKCDTFLFTVLIVAICYVQFFVFYLMTFDGIFLSDWKLFLLIALMFVSGIEFVKWKNIPYRIMSSCYWEQRAKKF